jgi:hypothetical protein
MVRFGRTGPIRMQELAHAVNAVYRPAVTRAKRLSSLSARSILH